MKLKKQEWLYMKNKEYVSLVKMIEYIEKAKKYTNGYTYELFCKDDKQQMPPFLLLVKQVNQLRIFLWKQ